MNERSEAKNLYSPSQLFSKSYSIAEKLVSKDQIKILSAKYGILDPDDIISPYELTLNKMSKEDKIKWKSRTQEQFENFNKKTVRIFMTGENYIFENNNQQFIYRFFPKGMGIGSRLRYLTELQNSIK